MGDANQYAPEPGSPGTPDAGSTQGGGPWGVSLEVTDRPLVRFSRGRAFLAATCWGVAVLVIVAGHPIWDGWDGDRRCGFHFTGCLWDVLIRFPSSVEYAGGLGPALMGVHRQNVVRCGIVLIMALMTAVGCFGSCAPGPGNRRQQWQQDQGNSMAVGVQAKGGVSEKEIARRHRVNRRFMIAVLGWAIVLMALLAYCVHRDRAEAESLARIEEEFNRLREEAARRMERTKKEFNRQQKEGKGPRQELQKLL